MKGPFLATLALVCTLIVGGCAAQSATTGTGDSSATQTDTATSGSTTSESGEITQLANPFVSANNLDELAQLAGFNVTFPERIDGVGTRSSMAAIPNELAQATYGTDDDQVLVRKGVDDGTGDISGDYNTYDVSDTVEIDGLTVTLRGDETNEYENAIWTHGTYAFAVDSDEDLTRDQVLAIVTQVS